MPGVDERDLSRGCGCLSLLPTRMYCKRRGLETRTRPRTRNEELGLTCRDRARAACVHTSCVPSLDRETPRSPDNDPYRQAIPFPKTKNKIKISLYRLIHVPSTTQLSCYPISKTSTTEFTICAQDWRAFSRPQPTASRATRVEWRPRCGCT